MNVASYSKYSVCYPTSQLTFARQMPDFEEIQDLYTRIGVFQLISNGCDTKFTKNIRGNDRYKVKSIFLDW
jgi:hypothetical protein